MGGGGRGCVYGASGFMLNNVSYQEPKIEIWEKHNVAVLSLGSVLF